MRCHDQCLIVISARNITNICIMDVYEKRIANDVSNRRYSSAREENVRETKEKEKEWERERGKGGEKERERKGGWGTEEKEGGVSPN